MNDAGRGRLYNGGHVELASERAFVARHSPSRPLNFWAPLGIVRVESLKGSRSRSESSHLTAFKLLSILCWLSQSSYSGMDGPDKRRKSNQYLKNNLC